MAVPPYIAVVGASQPTPDQEHAAEEVGRRLGDSGAIIITGGGAGVMAAAARGGRSAGALVLGILPGTDRSAANEWVSVALPTGLGEMRNGLVVRAADAVIAVGGAYGTLSEIALALAAGTPVVAIDSWPIRGARVAASPADAVELALGFAAAR